MACGLPSQLKITASLKAYSNLVKLEIDSLDINRSKVPRQDPRTAAFIGFAMAPLLCQKGFRMQQMQKTRPGPRDSTLLK